MKINNRFSGAQIRKEDLQGVRRAVLHAMGMENWQQQVLDREAVEAAIGMTSESQFD